MNRVQLADLFRKYMDDRCSAQEVRLLFSALRDAGNADLFRGLIAEHWQESPGNQQDPAFAERMRQAFANTDIRLRELLEGNAAPKRRILPFRWMRYAAAAVVLLVGTYAYLNRDNGPQPIHPPQGMLERPRSTLTFANGETIRIATAVREPQELYRAGGVALVQDSGEHIRVVGIGSDSLAALPVSLSVAESQQMTVRMPDGSAVTVNAGSTLLFPMVFGASSRNVELRGEAYFEVEADKKRPFFVKTADQLVRVHGTRFNVRSYPEEGKSTTVLLQGSVSVRRLESGEPREEYMLRPGERIVIAKTGPPNRQTIAKEEKPVAWARGLFSYNNAPLEDILRDFSRWYNVQVDWDNVPDLRFQGTIPKDYSLAEALSLIRRTSSITLELNDNHITFK